MSEAVFDGGVPARLTVEEFRRYHLQSFPKLAGGSKDEVIRQAIEDVYAMFAGVATLWDTEERYTWYKKTITCYRFLTAWYIADLYPMLTSGVTGTGGVPILRKKINGVDITFDRQGASSDLLTELKSNQFGMKAYLMIRTAPKRFRLTSARFV